MSEMFRKYPRTPHVSGSMLQPGDEGLAVVDGSVLAGDEGLVVEEKLDGANCGLWFDERGELQLQSRGHVLRGGPAEEQFTLFKRWGAHWAPALRDVLGSRLVMFGEWLHAKHTIFYDRLPHYFVEFDLWDRSSGSFLSTERRRRLLQPLPIVSAPILHRGPLPPGSTLGDLVGASRFCSPSPGAGLIDAAAAAGLAPEQVLTESESAGRAEGLYLKVEDGHRVVRRAKLVRAGFGQIVDASGSHWMTRQLLYNRLDPGVDLFDDSPDRGTGR